MLVLAARGLVADAPVVVALNLLGAALALGSAFMIRRNPDNLVATYLIASFLVFLIVALVVSGYQASVTVVWLLALPPVAILVLGVRPGIIVSLAFAPFFAWVLLLSGLVPAEALATEYRYRLPVVYLLITCVTGVYAWSSDYFYERLLSARERIDALEQFLPMCAVCKKVADDEDEWHEIETYLARKTDQIVSHGICPACNEQLYGNVLRARQSE